MIGEPCYSIVRKPKGFEASNEITLKRRMEGDDLERCQRALEELLQNILDGEKFPTNLMMSVINRYQMNRFSGDVGNRDKRIKKLLYVLWECLPKRGPDGKFLDKLVMVCGAFDRDLKHPNQYVCGAALRTLSKTREPEVIGELVHSMEKCLEWSHAYQRKNAVLSIAKIYKKFPDLIPSAPKTISEYLMKENDDECKKAALQALLEIDPDEAKPYLHSSNLQDIHCMNSSIQLLFVEIIKRVYNRGEEESRDYLSILKSLIKQSSSPSVRYQAASTLMRFTRDPESIKLVSACFIDICSKNSDNNVKLIALDRLVNLRKIKGAERVLRNSVMDILFILQSASDFVLQDLVWRLTLDLVSPLNVNGVVAALRHETRKNANDPEKKSYLGLLIHAAHNIAGRFPNAIVDHEMLDTLFDLIINNSVSDKITSDMILLFKVLMIKNPSNNGKVIRKIQDCFNLIKNSPENHRGLIVLFGEFSETQKQIEDSCKVIEESLGEIPIVDSEMRKLSIKTEEGGLNEEDTSSRNSGNTDVEAITKGVNRLVTADGSYATQSSINTHTTIPCVEEHPPLRSYYLNNNFTTVSALSDALLMMAFRYQQIATAKESNKMLTKLILIQATILHLNESSLTDNDGNALHINSEDTGNLWRSINIINDILNNPDGVVRNIMKKTVNDVRSQTIDKVNEEGGLSNVSFKKDAKTYKFDDPIETAFFGRRDEEIDLDDLEKVESDQVDLSAPDLFSEVPLTGTLDAIYAYCQFDVNHYDVGLNIHLENRSPHTLENVTLELAARGENTSKFIDRPDPIVLAPRSSACISTNIKVVSAENRRLFGSIVYDDTSKSLDDREQFIMLNDITVNITDYIKPASVSPGEFHEVWRDCEWENKVTVKTKLMSLQEYLDQLIAATNMRCIASLKSINSNFSVLCANLYGRSSFGEEALVNVSIDKDSPSSIISGDVRIRSRSQGMALSLGDKITAAQSSQAT